MMGSSQRHMTLESDRFATATTPLLAERNPAFSRIAGGEKFPTEAARAIIARRGGGSASPQKGAYAFALHCEHPDISAFEADQTEGVGLTAFSGNINPTARLSRHGNVDRRSPAIGRRRYCVETVILISGKDHYLHRRGIGLQR